MKTEESQRWDYSKNRTRRKCKFLLEDYVSPFSEPLIWYIPWCLLQSFSTMEFLLQYMKQALGFPLEFGSSQQKGKQQELLSGATGQAVTLWSLYLTPAVTAGELLPQATCRALGPRSTSSSFSFHSCSVSAKGPGSPHELMLSQKWDNIHKKDAQSSKLNAIIIMSNTGEARDGQMGTHFPEK